MTSKTGSTEKVPTSKALFCTVPFAERRVLQEILSRLKRQMGKFSDSLHDLCHDFAHRAGEAGWILEEVAYYL